MRRRVILTSQRPVYDRPPVTRHSMKRQAEEQEGVGRKNGDPLGGPLPPHPRIPETGEERRREASVAGLLSQASLLTKTERQELLDQLSLDQRAAPASFNRDLDMWATAVGTALDEVVGSAEGGSYGSLLVKRLLGSTSCWAPVERFMTTSKLQELRVIERQAIYNLLAQLLVDHAGYVARKSGAPLGPKLVGQCTGSLPGIFEASFPGYLAAGLAPVIAQRMSHAPG